LDPETLFPLSYHYPQEALDITALWYAQRSTGKGDPVKIGWQLVSTQGSRALRNGFISISPSPQDSWEDLVLPLLVYHAITLGAQILTLPCATEAQVANADLRLTQLKLQDLLVLPKLLPETDNKDRLDHYCPARLLSAMPSADFPCWFGWHWPDHVVRGSSDYLADMAPQLALETWLYPKPGSILNDEQPRQDVPIKACHPWYSNLPYGKPTASHVFLSLGLINKGEVPLSQVLANVRK